MYRCQDCGSLFDNPHEFKPPFENEPPCCPFCGSTNYLNYFEDWIAVREAKHD